VVLPSFRDDPRDRSREWFAGLADGGRIVDDLQARPWAHPTGRSSIVAAFG
jgi:hypothetical protein